MRCISSTGIIYLFIYLLLATNLVFNKCTNQRQAAGFCNEWFSMLSVGSVTSHEPSPHAPRSDLSHLVSWGKLLSIHCSLLAWLGQGAQQCLSMLSTHHHLVVFIFLITFILSKIICICLKEAETERMNKLSSTGSVLTCTLWWRLSHGLRSDTELPCVGLKLRNSSHLAVGCTC